MSRFQGKNLLCIYYHFPPIKGVGTLRNYKFYKSLQRVARKSFVLTTSNRNYLLQEEFQDTLDRVLNIPTIDFRTIHLELHGEGLLIPNERKYSLINNILQKAIKIPIIDQLIGEGGWYFTQKGIKKGQQLIDKEGVEVICSSYSPFASHRIAYNLKKKNPHIYWIADFRDISFMGLDKKSQTYKQQERKHKKILSIADEVTTVSNGLRKELLSFHSRVQLIRNGVDREQTLNSISINDTFPYFTLAYTGIIYENKQKADILAKALSNLIQHGYIEKSKIQFINAGKDGAFWRSLFSEYELESILVDKGHLTIQQSISLQRKSHMNVLLSWASEDVQGVVTAKVYEYLFARNPIVGIINGSKDEEIEFIVENSGIGKVFYNSEIFLSQVEQYILRIYRAWEHGQPIRFQKADLSQFTWDAQFSNWLEGNKHTRTQHNQQ